MITEQRNYLLRIKLSDTKISRDFVVPNIISLDRLHDVIQIVMGWEDYHLHEFKIGKQRYTEVTLEDDSDAKIAGKYTLGDLIKQKGRT